MTGSRRDSDPVEGPGPSSEHTIHDVPSKSTSAKAQEEESQRRSGTYGPCVVCKAEGHEAGPFTLWYGTRLCPECLDLSRRTEEDDAKPVDPELTAMVAEVVDRESRLIDAGAWLVGAGDPTPAIWGSGDEVLWSPGEPLLLTAAEGVGKTTLAQRVMLARVGIGGEVLGFPVEPSERPVLYIAADRPAQARRSLHRMANPEDVAGRLTVWRGPLPFLLNHDDAGAMLLDLADEAGSAGTLFIDTLSAVASELTKDEGGAGAMRALAMVVAAGIEVMVCHHDRKEGAGELRKVPRISDVYGSRWIPAHSGSVLFIAGRAGDPIVKLHHVKQPVHEIGPLELTIDHDSGTVSVSDGVDPLAILTKKGKLTARELADLIWPGGRAADKERARRTLDRLVADGLARRVDGVAGGEAATYQPTEGGARRGTRTPPGTEAAQQVHEVHETHTNKGTRQVHEVHEPVGTRFRPSLEGAKRVPPLDEEGEAHQPEPGDNPLAYVAEQLSAEDEPLGVWAGRHVTEVVYRCACDLDDLGLPLLATYDTCFAALDAAGKLPPHVATVALAVAYRHRLARAEEVPT